MKEDRRNKDNARQYGRQRLIKVARPGLIRNGCVVCASRMQKLSFHFSEAKHQGSGGLSYGVPYLRIMQLNINPTGVSESTFSNVYFMDLTLGGSGRLVRFIAVLSIGIGSLNIQCHLAPALCMYRSGLRTMSRRVERTYEVRFVVESFPPANRIR